MKSFFKLLFLFLFFHRSVWAQNVQIVSHYPETAYITERLLPFSVIGEGDGQEVRIQSIHLTGGGCRFMIDPFYGKIFHIYCKTPTRVQVEVSVVSSGQGTSKISTGELHIRGKDEQQPPENGGGGN